MSELSQHASSLIAEMTLREKLAQLVGLWAKAKRADEAVAPMQDRMLLDQVAFSRFARDGLGQLTRHYGTRPIDPEVGRSELRDHQNWIAQETRQGIGMLVHEECLTGVMTSGATTYPTPLAWGATFHPELVERMAHRIGADMRSLGIHQGLAPVLDIARDARWGRVEECISEDPVLVGAIGTAYVTGLEQEGRVATLKHFVGYSESRAGRNHAPVAIGPRELRETFLPPFEQALRDGGARSVMNSYTEVDRIPVAANEELLTGILRDEWGFRGTVVADYFAITFLQTMHAVAESLQDAAVAALSAGLDVELPTGSAYLEPLVEAIESGRLDESLVDRALVRVMRQKDQLGLLDPLVDAQRDAEQPIDLDSSENRGVARELAEQSVVLLHNAGVLPASVAAGGRIAVVGPNASSVSSLLGCYSFDNHVLPHHPDLGAPSRGPSVLDAIRAEWPDAQVEFLEGCTVRSDDASSIPAAAQLVEGCDLGIVVVGDVSGMFGRGTSGEGCDVVTLELPGAQRALLDACIATGTPVVVVLVTGRPYVLDGLVDSAAAIVQAFLPGQEGAAAIAGVLSGRVNPSGRLPVQLPHATTSYPTSYLAPALGGLTPMSSSDPTAAFPFGFGLSYSSVEYGEATVIDSEVAIGGWAQLRFPLSNTSDRDAVEIVQVYASDPVASVTRPVRALAAFGRIAVAAGETVTVRVRVASSVFALVDRSLRRVVEPGEVGLTVARNAADPGQRVSIRLTGAVTEVSWPTTADRRVWAE